LGWAGLCICVAACGGKAEQAPEGAAGTSAKISGSAGSGEIPYTGAAGSGARTAGAAGGSMNPEGGSTTVIETNPPPRAPLKPQVWQVTAQISTTTPPQFALPCRSITFFLDLSHVTSDGDFMAPVTSTTNAPFEVSGQLENQLLTLGSTGLACNIQTTQSLVLAGSDTDGDGVADSLSGSAAGTINTTGGDMILTEPVQLEFTAVTDTIPPTLTLPSAALSDPVAGLTLTASEPVSAPAALSLSGSSTVPLSWSAEAPASFSSPVLPFGGSWMLTGSLKDLSGNLLVAAGTVTTVADPGMFAQDGFEGPLVAAVSSGAPKVVSGLGTIAALEGAKSLWLGPADALTFHLPSASGGKTLRFTVRAATSQGVTASVSFSLSGACTAGAIGHAPLQAPASAYAGASTPTGDTNWQLVTDAQTFGISLPDDPEDVLVRCNSITGIYGLGPGVQGALLLDNLTLE